MQSFGTEQYIANLSIDCVIFGYEDCQLKVLLGKVKYGSNLYNLPGGHIRKTESVDQAAARLLAERTQLKDLHLNQFKVFGDAKRIVSSQYKNLIHKELSKRYTKKDADWILDRFVCVGYYALVDISKVKPVVGTLDQALEWKSIHEIPKMIHDHQEILEEALIALRQNFDHKLNAFNLLPKTFTMKELKSLYEAVYEKTFPMNNFQKKILVLDVLERLEKKFTGAQNKAPYLYQFKK
jgi:ADP-ribose pyrophosphatase YjhB (NUDIX family)